MADPRSPRSEAAYVVAGCRPWNRETFDARLAALPGTWHFVADPAALDRVLERVAPRFVFFLHWSWIVPARIHQAHECVVFHATDLPYGRGGSPIQNLIVRGHADTVLSALRMDAGLDTGPIYAKEPVSLAGPAEEIYRRIDGLAADLVVRIAAEQPEPVPQVGEAVVFARRTPDQSAVPVDAVDVRAWHDHIRMLDAEGYPHAFVDHGALRITFRNARLDGGAVRADVTIAPREDPT